MVDHLLELPPEEWKLAPPASAPNDEWSPRDLDSFRASLLEAVRKVAVPAFRRYCDRVQGAIGKQTAVPKGQCVT